MTEPGDQLNPRAAENGHILASHADRDRVLGMLKTAFVRGMLTKGEFDSRVAAALASRTWADLARLTTDLPRGLPDSSQPPPAELPAISRVTLLTSAVLIAAPLFFAVGLAGDKAGVVGALFIAVFLLILGALAGGLVASVIAAAVKAESRHRSRSRRRPPPKGPGRGGRGSAPRTQHRQAKRPPRHLPWSECRI